VDLSTAHGGPIGVGIVGLSAASGWAATAHVPALAALDRYELRALSASSAESARAAGEKHGVPLAFASAEELLGNNGTDGDLLVTNDLGTLNFGRVMIQRARGRQTALVDLTVPEHYPLVPKLFGREAEPSYNVAHA
jgi:hypothetical protein